MSVTKKKVAKKVTKKATKKVVKKEVVKEEKPRVITSGELMAKLFNYKENKSYVLICLEQDGTGSLDSNLSHEMIKNVLASISTNLKV